MRKAPIVLAVLVAVALLAIACKDRIDKGIVERADAATKTVTFAPVADAYVDASTPDTNDGAATQLKADGGPVKISYLRFDVSGLPSGSTVTSAKLRLYVSNETPDGPGVRNINTGWEENTVTWNTRPSIDETAIVSDLGAITLGRWVEMNVTPMITGNGAFNIALTQPHSDGSGFHSREGANKPQLIVTTEDNVTPPPPPATTKQESDTGATLAGYLVRERLNTAASGGKEVAYYTTGSASYSLSGSASSIILRAREDACNGDPILNVFVDGIKQGSATVNGGAAFADYKVPLSGVADGAHTYRIEYNNDTVSGCDRNVYLDYFSLESGGASPPADTTVKIVAAGDIASSGNLAASQATAQLVSARPDATVLALGDTAYEGGTLTEFNNYYDPSWGAFKSRTKPVPGNHEYTADGTTPQYGAGYFDYFGAAAHIENAGSYSYDLGAWHIVALNTGQCYGSSEADGTRPRCGPGDPMISWLQNDLEANTNMCTLAYFHHPRFSSSWNQPSAPAEAKTLYQVLYNGNADVILNGHAHDYERFAPMNPQGQIDDVRGIREFIVGTGGRSINALGTKVAGSQVFYGGYGILDMSLNDQDYSWSFVPASGTFTDSGSGTCH